MFVIMASQRCIFEALAEFMTSLFKLYQGNPLHLSRAIGKKKSIYFKVWIEMGGKTEVFYCNVKIMLHRRPNLIHDE